MSTGGSSATYRKVLRVGWHIRRWCVNPSHNTLPTSEGSLDTLYVPSSQGNEIMNDEGLHKELRYYCVGQSDNVRSVQYNYCD